MKQFLNILFGAACAALMVTGCAKDQTVETNDNPTPIDGAPITMQFRADFAKPAADTRASITVGDDTFTGVWDDQDAIGVMVNPIGQGYLDTQFPAIFSLSNDAFATTMTGIPDMTGSFAYRAYSPYVEGLTGAAIAIPFGNLRTQDGNNFNSAYDVLAADELSFAAAAPGKDEAGNDVKFTFTRLNTILYYDITGSNTDPVKYVLLTSANETQMISAASLDFDLTQGSAATAALNTADQSNVIATDFDGSVTADAVKAYFNVPAGTYDKLNVSVITNNADGTNPQIGSATITPDGAYEAGTLYQSALTGMPFKALAAPSFAWEGQDMNAVHPIGEIGTEEGQYPAAINITVPGGIAGLTVDIKSDVLNNMIGISKLDLFNPGEMKDLFDMTGLPYGTQIQYKKSCIFDITNLVPLISALSPAPGSEHAFTVTVTDLAGQQTTQTLTFNVPLAPAIAYNNDADLWLNTASFTLSNIPATAQSVSVQYRIAGETAWQNATVSGDKATIAPVWTDKTAADWNTPNTVMPYSRIAAGAGIFAGHTYEYQMTIDGGTPVIGTFDTAVGDVIPNGDMKNWSTINQPGALGPGDVAYPNASGDSFWGCGNNGTTKTLCTSNTTIYGAASPSALLQSSSTLGIMAAGNMFTGSFTFTVSGILGMSSYGTVNFGQKYVYTARPSAMSVQYKATIGTVDSNKWSGPLETGDQDKARIYVCIVDWNAPHQVTSGMSGAPKGTWDPETKMDPGEGNVIGYGSMWIDKSTDGNAMIEATIPINWYDKTVKPSNNYTIVISAAANAYGDFFDGYSKSALYLDDFRWVY